jgi:hypothetical protein
MIRFKTTTVLSVMMLYACTAFSQKAPPDTVAGIPVNYDEDKVGTYSLPDPLTLADGKKVKDSRTWISKRRPEILALYEQYQFGKIPALPQKLRAEVFDKGTPAFNGKAIRRQVRIYLAKDTSVHKVDLLIYLPADAAKPSPLLLNVSFSANSNVVNDPGVRPGLIWSKEGKRIPAPATEFGKLNIEQFISAGIGIATVCYTDIEPDSKEGAKFGIRAYYAQLLNSKPAPDDWGAISAFSWGLSKAMDYLETDKDIDAKKIALTGASRLGKTVLWTGARDTRFAMIIASISGEGGAALSRRNFGETVKHITDTSRYFYQFAPNYHTYSDRISDLPIDGHMLISLIAPRPLLLQTGDTDFWSDPKGEFLAAVAAEPVYTLFRKDGPKTSVMPAAGDSSMLNTLGYFMHKGGHTVLPSDWEIFIRYMKKHL